MPEKNPFNYPLATYLWVIGIAAAGGLIAALKKDQSIKKTIIDVMASVLAGSMTFWFCEANSINPFYAVIAIAAAGHMGTKALKKFSDWFDDKFLGSRNESKPRNFYTDKPSNRRSDDDDG